MIPIYHSAFEVLIKVDKYSDSRGRVLYHYRRKKILWYHDAGSTPAD